VSRVYAFIAGAGFFELSAFPASPTDPLVVATVLAVALMLALAGRAHP